MAIPMSTLRPTLEVWAILFEDECCETEIFSGHGAEKAARTRFKALADNWECYLLAPVALLDENEALRKALASEWPNLDELPEWTSEQKVEMQTEYDEWVKKRLDARKDIERLDWLGQNHIEQSNPPQSPGLYKGLSQYKKIGINCRPGLTLREAIDAAMPLPEPPKEGQ